MFFPPDFARAEFMLGAMPVSTNSVVQAALTNKGLDQQGVPHLQQRWIAYHYPSQRTPSVAVTAEPETKR